MNDSEVRIGTELDTSQAEKQSEKLGKALDDNIGKGAKKAAKGLAAIGTAAVAAGGTAVAAMVKSATKGYAEYEQLVGGVDTLFKKSSKTIQKYADDAFKTAGISANNYMQLATSFSASLLQGLGGDTKKAAKIADQAIIDMSDNANKMGTSMEMIQNAYQGFAKGNFMMLDNLKLGYGGTKTEMARLINESKVLGDTFVETGKNGNFDEVVTFDKIIEAIHVVQNDLGITGTTAKEASTTIEGSFNSMKAAWDNLMVGMANPDADFNKLVGNLVDTAKTFLENLLPVLEKSISGIGDLITDIAPKVAEVLPKLAIKIIPSFVKSAISVAQALMTTIPEVLAMLVSSLISNLPILLNGINEMANILLQNLPTLISQLISGLQDTVPLIVSALPQIFQNLINGAFEVLSSIFDNLPQLVDMAIQIIIGLTNALISAIPLLISKLPELIQKIVDGLIGSLPLLINGAISLVLGIVKALPQIIMSLVKALPQIIKSVVSGLISALPLLIKGAITLVVELVKNLPQIIVALISAIPQIIGDVCDALIDNIPLLIKANITMIVELVKAMPKILKSLISAIPKIVVSIIAAFNKMASKYLEIGLNMIKGIWNGIKNAGKWLMDKIKGFLGGVVDGIKDFLGIKSPSRLMRDEVGKMMALGMYQGFKDNNPMAQIKKDLATGVGSLQSSINMQWSASSIGNAVSQAIDGLTVSVDGRTFGRIVRSY